MSYVITQSCCNDASCVPTCPVDCIHPAPGEPGYMTTEMLYIDPDTCIECSACVQVCPVNAIHAEDELSPAQTPFLQINADYYKRHPLDALRQQPTIDPPPLAHLGGLRVAVVGSGPAGSYAAEHLLGSGAEVDIFERLLTPLGLVRFGVAPDHEGTKSASTAFPYYGHHPKLRLHLGVNVGEDISHAELLDYYHAVIYAVGASSDRRLHIPGEDLPGSHSATEFVAWYNGHPDAANLSFDLTSERAVVIGNGNVALDVARILVSDPDKLARTDIADHALDCLRKSAVKEVVVVGRRGPAWAAFSVPELLGLIHHPDIDVVVEEGLVLDEHSRGVVEDPESEVTLREKAKLVAELSGRASDLGRRRIILKFLASPTEIIGHDRVQGVRLVRNEVVRQGDGSLSAQPTDQEMVLDAGLVLRSVGYRGKPVADLPFDEDRGVVPHSEGRVEGPRPPAGAYVTGWIKRGPSGVIGTNRQCAAETVATLAEDFLAGRLAAPKHDAAQIDEMLGARLGYQLGLADWKRIDAFERAAGEPAGRPRVKLIERQELMSAAASRDVHA